jgi:hypothetical protein
MTLPSTLDPTVAPKGKHVASLFIQVLVDFSSEIFVSSFVLVFVPSFFYFSALPFSTLRTRLKAAGQTKIETLLQGNVTPSSMNIVLASLLLLSMRTS